MIRTEPELAFLSDPDPQYASGSGSVVSLGIQITDMALDLQAYIILSSLLVLTDRFFVVNLKHT